MKHPSAVALESLVAMTPYPPDAFLSDLAAVAGKVDLDVFERAFHPVPQKEK
jgi:hypothetical protein